MRKLIALGTALCISFGAIPQISLQSSINTGFAFPTGSGKTNSAHNGNALHYGNHLDFLMGESGFRMGIGGFAGQVIGIGAGDYKTNAQAIASKYRLQTDKIIFNESPFRSSAFLIGPVADWQRRQMSINFWAKGGYSLNEPERFSTTIQDQGAVSNVFVNKAGTDKNSFGYNLGGGVRYKINEMLSMQLAASYFDTKTDLINYNYDREKGTSPLNFTAHNSFIQAVFGLHFNMTARKSKTYEKQKDANIVSSRYIVKSDGVVYDLAKKDDRGDYTNETDKRNFSNDTIIFEPQSIRLDQISPSDFSGKQLQASNNFLTAFLYQTSNGIDVSQCSGQKMPGDPIPGLDVKLKNMNSGNNYTAHTNEDGSFSVRNIEDGIYQAMTNSDTTSFAVNNKTANANYKLVEIENGECGIHSNNIIYVDGQMYAEVITAREASSGMASGRITAPRDIATGQASGKRMHKPISVIRADFDLNYNNIIKVDGLLYAEVRTARETGSGMATGRRTFISGDLDGDGLEDRVIIKTSASQNGQTLRKFADRVITRPNSSQSGQTLRGFYSIPEVNDELIIVQDGNDDDCDYYVVHPRDIATGQSSGKISRQDLNSLINEGENVYILSPRDAATGQASGKRTYQPRDIATGQASGKGTQSSYWSNDPYAEDATRYATDPYVEDAMSIYTVEASSGQQMDFAVPLFLSADNTTWTINTSYPVQSVTRATKTRSNIQNNRTTTKSRSNIGNNRMTGNSSDTLQLQSEVQRTKSRSNIQNNRTATKTRSNIQNNRTADNSSDTLQQNKATVITKRSNIKSQKMSSGSPGLPDANYASINTTRSNIKHNKMAGGIDIVRIDRIHCSDGTCSMNAIVDIDGVQYSAVVSGVLKTKHDTVKNSIGNIR
jgi:opacity protein-like surface antigen